MSRGVEGREILMGSEVGVDAPSESGPRASGLEKEDVRFDEDEGIREPCPVGSYPRGGCGVDCKRIGLAGGVRE
jgi:hypothetical protein